MSTKPSTIEYIEDQLASLGVTSRKMFGEYTLYCDGKVVALVCDDALFVKITEVGKLFLGEKYVEAPAYPGAKPSMRIDEDDIENREWITKLIQITTKSLPKPKPQARAKKKWPKKGVRYNKK